MRTLKNIVKHAFQTVGLNISKVGNDKNPPTPLVHHGIELLFDVGASAGLYGRYARTRGYKGRIVSFEPLPEEHAKLLKLASSDPLWHVHDRCAVGSEAGKAEINISKNSLSSSLLNTSQTLTNAEPETSYIGKAKTDVIALDSVFDFYRTYNEKTYLKIDTQGFESEVLKGINQNLKNIFAIELELSIIQLYEGQELYKHFFQFFEANDFYLWSLEPIFANVQTGQLLQFDAVFIRK